MFYIQARVLLFPPRLISIFTCLLAEVLDDINLNLTLSISLSFWVYDDLRGINTNLYDNLLYWVAGYNGSGLM